MRVIALMNSRLRLILLPTLFFLLLTPSALADWAFLPESHHQLYQTYGLFFDEQTTLVNYGQGRIWGALGGTLPLYGSEDSPHHYAIVAHATANASLHYNDNFRIWTETVDARVGFAFEMEIDPSLRFSIGLTHNSGHTADGLNEADQALMEPTLGEEFIPIRLVYDWDKKIRVGGTFKPFIRTYPDLQKLAFEQFIEYFPWGAKDSAHSGTPYIALGLDEYGVDSLTLTFHSQIGVYFGNHFSDGFHQTLRAVLGYYNGADPRLKYFQFLNAKMSFGYLGLMLDI